MLVLPVACVFAQLGAFLEVSADCSSGGSTAAMCAGRVHLPVQTLQPVLPPPGT